ACLAQGPRRLAAGCRTRYQNRSFCHDENALSVLCLIANPAEPALDPALVARVHAEIGGEIDWLHQRIACDIIKPKHAQSVEAARAIVAGRPVDVAQVPLANRRKKLLIADMDSTMIEQECI